MLKARAAAGDLALGDRFVRGVAPFVYPEHLEPAAIDDVRRTKVRLEEYIRQRGKELTEVKRGRGGIRDVEFAVQLLQIVHGRRDERLRSPSTLAALAALARGGLRRRARRRSARPTPTGSYGGWSTGCRWSATCRPTTSPTTRGARRTLARSLGLRRRRGARGRVRPHDRDGAPAARAALLPAAAGGVRGPGRAAVGRDREATQELLDGPGVRRQPTRGYDLLARLVDPATRMGKVMGTIFPVVAPVLALAADPDAALVRLARIADAVGDRRRAGRRAGHRPRGGAPAGARGRGEQRSPPT